MYNTDVIYPECGFAGSRTTNGNVESNNPSKNSKVWDVKLFPNPAGNMITIISKKESESLNIEIRDVNNRLLLTKELNTSGFIANLELELMNGVYIISFKNGDNETITKKLFIAR